MDHVTRGVVRAAERHCNPRKQDGEAMTHPNIERIEKLREDVYRVRNDCAAHARHDLAFALIDQLAQAVDHLAAICTTQWDPKSSDTEAPAPRFPRAGTFT